MYLLLSKNIQLAARGKLKFVTKLWPTLEIVSVGDKVKKKTLLYGYW